MMEQEMRPQSDKPDIEIPSNPQIYSIKISVFRNGAHSFEAFNDNGGAVSIGDIRKSLTEVLRHCEDRLMAILAEQTARALLKQASETKDRNGLARFLSKFH